MSLKNCLILLVLLLFDAQVRLRQADIIQEVYRGTLSFELGTISAAVKDIFKRMVNNYRFYRNNTRTGLDTLVLGLYAMVGDYHDIRMEKGLYYNILKVHRKRKESIMLNRQALIDRYKEQQTAKHGGPKPKRRHRAEISDEQEKYKRALRYKTWANKWANFSPEIEGVEININDPRLIL